MVPVAARMSISNNTAGRQPSAPPMFMYLVKLRTVHNISKLDTVMLTVPSCGLRTMLWRQRSQEPLIMAHCEGAESKAREIG